MTCRNFASKSFIASFIAPDVEPQPMIRFFDFLLPWIFIISKFFLMYFLMSAYFFILLFVFSSVMVYDSVELPKGSDSYEEFLTKDFPGIGLVILKVGVLFGFCVEENSDSAGCLS